MQACPACDGGLAWRHNGLWCLRCGRKVEGCCEGAPEPSPATCAGAPADGVGSGA